MASSKETSTETPNSKSDGLQVIKYDLQNISMIESYVTDIFTAYGLSPSGLMPDEVSRVIHDISQTKKTFPYLQDVIHSNRYPYTIMTIGAKVGMYIPPRKRLGIEAYNFFLANIKYYEPTFERAEQTVPNLYEIYMAKDRVGLLMKFRDDEILRAGYKFSRNHANRKEMIEKFIENNIAIYGQFTLDTNSRSTYGTKAKVIIYQEPNLRIAYSTDELAMLFDLQRGVVWKDCQGFTHPQPQRAFSRFSLHHLRQQILEKFGQWRHRDGFTQAPGPVGLNNILIALENLLANDIRNDAGAYLGNPSLN